MNNLCSRKKLQFLVKLILALLIVNYFGYFLLTNFYYRTIPQSNLEAIKLPLKKSNNAAADDDEKKFEEFVERRLKQQQEAEAVAAANRSSLTAAQLQDKNSGATDNTINEMQERKRFYAIDGNGMASVNTEIIRCDPNTEVEVVGQNMFAKADFTYFLNSLLAKPSLAQADETKRRHYYMVCKRRK